MLPFKWLELFIQLIPKIFVFSGIADKKIQWAAHDYIKAVIVKKLTIVLPDSV